MPSRSQQAAGDAFAKPTSPGKATKASQPKPPEPTQATGFVERRQPQHNRRASDRMPVLDTDAMTAIVEAKLAQAIAPAVQRVIHRNMQSAMREAVAVMNDANLTTADGAAATAPQGAPAPATQANPQATAPAAAVAPAKAPAGAAAADTVVQNGVRCPDAGSVTGKLWLLYAKEGAGVTLTRAKELAKAAGLNPSSAAIALYNWRKFHSVPSPKG